MAGAGTCKKLKIAARIFAGGKSYDCSRCKRKCFQVDKYVKIKAKYGILKDRTLIIDNFDKVVLVIDYLKQQMKIKSDLTVCETILNICGKIFLTDLISDIFERYYFEKIYNVCSYGNIDDIPRYWKTIKNIIDTEMHIINDEKLQAEEQKHKQKKKRDIVGR